MIIGALSKKAPQILTRCSLVNPLPITLQSRIFCAKKPSRSDDIVEGKPTGTLPSDEAPKQVSVDPQVFYSLTPEQQRELVRKRYEKEIQAIQDRRAELDQVSHHVAGFNQMTLAERLKVEEGLKAPKDVKAYLELLGFDVRRNELYPVHPQVGPAAKVTPYGRNFFFPFSWGVCLVAQIGFMPDISVLAAGAVAGVAMRVATTAAVAAHGEYKGEVEHFDETKFFRIPTENLVMTAAIGTSVATTMMALVVNPWYAAALVPACGAFTWFFPQYAPLTAALGGILGSLTGPYLEYLPWEKILPVQASVLTAAACSHYVFHMEGAKATVAALGTLSLGSAAVLSGMHKMFYPFFSLASLQMIGTAIQNFHVRSDYGTGRRGGRTGWYKDFPPGSQQAIFGFFVFFAMILGRRYSHRVGLIIRDRETDDLALDKRENVISSGYVAEATTA
jgi:hypothetical protein